MFSTKAEGNPFDNGEFTLVRNRLMPYLENDPLHFSANRIQWPAGWEEEQKPVHPGFGI